MDASLRLLTKVQVLNVDFKPFKLPSTLLVFAIHLVKEKSKRSDLSHYKEMLFNQSKVRNITTFRP